MYHTEIYQSIMNNYHKYEVKAMEPQIINEKYIIPGLNGRKVDIKASYQQMKKLGYYNDQYYVYQVIYPQKIKKDYIVLKGNPIKKSIAIITDNKIADYDLTNMTEYKNYPYQLNIILINNTNYYLNKNQVEAGSIVYVEHLSDELLLYLINTWLSKGLKIVSLNDLLSS